MFFLPWLVAATGLVRAQAGDARTVFMKPQLDRITIPAKYFFRLTGIPSAILKGHFRLKNSAFRSPHFLCGLFQIIDVTGIQRDLFASAQLV
jgi:hypothetical protein